MKVAVPTDNELLFYHANPITAPKFSIYHIDGDYLNLTFSLVDIVINPWIVANKGVFDEEQINCRCDEEECFDIRHISEHYALLEVIGECDYMLADGYCKNTLNTLAKAGIKIFKIPSIIRKIDYAIKNFILGASLADNVKHVHYAS